MNRLKELRREKRISQSELAKEFNVAQNTISNWENGVRDIDTDKLRALSNYFKVSVDYLLCLSDDPTPLGLHTFVRDHEATILGDMNGLTQEDLKEVANYIAYLKSKHSSKE